jgi:hypothetical protein
MTRLKKKKKINLRKERVRSYKVILNILIIVNKGIMPEIATRNRNKIKELK